MGEQAVLQSYEPRHRAGLVKLWARYFGAWSAERLEQRWAWQYESNPFVPVRRPVILVGMLGDEVVGHIGGFPLPLRIDGQTMVGLGATGLVADEAHRWLGFRLVRGLLAEGPVLASGMARAAEELFVKCGSKPIPESRTEYFFPRRYEGELAGKLRWRLPKSVGRVVSPRMMGMMAPWYRPKGQPRPAPLPGGDGTGTIRVLDRFGDDYDRLWQSASVGLRTTVERDAAYMNWRYCDLPGQHAIRVGWIHPETGLGAVCVGLVRVRLDRFGSPCARIGEVVELVGTEPTALKRVLSAAMRALDEERVDAITSARQRTCVREVLREAGFIERHDGEFSGAISAPGKIGSLDGADAVLYSAGDGDCLFTIAI